MKIKINGKYYNFFNDVSITYNLDSIASAFTFKALFNPNNPDHKEVFKPLSYHTVEIYTDKDDLLLTGNIINLSLVSGPQRNLQSVTGYSKAGILEDCTIPVSSYPLEKNNVNLSDLIAALITPFGISFINNSRVQNEMNLQYKKTVAGPSETIKSYIAKLAAQRDILLGHNEKGDITLFKLDLNSKPKLYLNKENTLGMTLKINGQALHSKISVIRQPNKDNTSLIPVDTVNNDLINSERSITKVLSSGSETDTSKAANALLSKELKNILFSVKLNYIDTSLKCGDLVEILNEEIYLYSRTKLVIQSIVIKQNQSSETMELKLVLPETFTGEEPKNIFQ